VFYKGNENKEQRKKRKLDSKNICSTRLDSTRAGLWLGMLEGAVIWCSYILSKVFSTFLGLEGFIWLALWRRAAGNFWWLNRHLKKSQKAIFFSDLVVSFPELENRLRY
jgi:hypothetical protein